jgi:hypothetical protein
MTAAGMLPGALTAGPGSPGAALYQRSGDNRGWQQTLFTAHLLFDQPGDFSLMGKSLSFNILFRVNQLAVTLYIEDTASAFDQFNI